MKHLALIQTEFLKTAHKWDDLTYDEQKAYLNRHPLSRRKITARPSSEVTPTSDSLHKKYVDFATENMNKGYVIAVPKDGRKQYFKIEDGKLWTSKYENADWTLDETQKLPHAHGALVVGPTLQRFDTTKQPTHNAYFKVTEPIPAWVLTGHRPSSYYYGSSNLLTPSYERKILPVGTSVQILVGGDFAIVNGQRQAVRFTDPEADRSPFEKNYGYDPTKKQLPLKALQEVTAEGRVIEKEKQQPVKQEVKQTVVPTVNLRPPKSMSKREITNLLNDSGISDSVRYSDQKGGFVFKRGYFYRQGMTSDKFANAVMTRSRNVGLTPVLLDSTDKWHRWPKDSWFEAVVKFEQLKDDTAIKSQETAKGFPVDDILRSIKMFEFPGERQYARDEPEVYSDNSGNVTEVNRSFRDLGHWHSRPGEEDDDYPNWDSESAKKYKQLFEDWAKRQSWFDSKTMSTFVEPEEKRWVTFGVKRKKVID